MSLTSDLTNTPDFFPALLSCNIGNAIKGKQGFMADTVITTAIDSVFLNNFQFCIRPIGDQRSTKGRYRSFLSTQEAQWIINPVAKGGAGLALMPLYGISDKPNLLEEEIDALEWADDAQKLAIYHVKLTVKLMHTIGFPTGVTIWFDMGTLDKLKTILSIDDCLSSEKKKQFVKTYTERLVKHGYSVGYYYSEFYGAGCDICPPCSPDGINTLQTVAGPAAQLEFLSQTLTIGDNNGPNTMRWIMAAS